MTNYDVMGYTEDRNILFYYKNKHIIIKPTLPKSDLCFRLDIDAHDIDKHFRDRILNQAKEGGCWLKIYIGKSGDTYEDWFLIPNEDEPWTSKWIKREHDNE